MIWPWIETSSADTGFVADDELGLHRERARDADALALSAGQLVRIALGHFRPQPDLVEQLGDALASARRASGTSLVHVATARRRSGRRSCAD